MDRQVVATEKGNSAVPSDTNENLNSDPSKMTLSRKIVIGLTAGIACGLFFGEICGGLSIVGNAYIALMQMTVLPYIVLALIVNIGSLTLDTARHIAARAEGVQISRVAEFFEAETPPADGLVISAEAGSAWTLIYPKFQVVLPFREVTAWPLGYATAPGDTEFLRFLDLWVELTRKTGLVSRLRDHWILGRTAVPRSPRWSVIRNVLHWVE